jgi:hypothetical protein
MFRGVEPGTNADPIRVPVSRKSAANKKRNLIGKACRETIALPITFLKAA